MDRKLIFRIVATWIILIFSVGCQTLDKNIGKDLNLGNLQLQRTVENNVFSSSFPEIKIKVSPELQYLGTVQLDQSEKYSLNTRIKDVNQSSFDASSYFFGQFNEDNKIAKGILIRTLVVRGDPNQFIQSKLRIENLLDSGKMKILDEEYQYNLFTQQNLLTEEERKLLKTDSAPSCSLVKEIKSKAGIGNKSSMQIYYFEDISKLTKGAVCKDSLNEKSLTEEQKQFIQGFTERSFKSIRIMRTSQPVDTTSKYVDQESKEENAVKPIQDKASPKDQTIETKLKSLKDLHDKNLITDEDYNKKKAELLKEL
jgi:hypothetical protein